jgi:hypothetical protein
MLSINLILSFFAALTLIIVAIYDERERAAPGQTINLKKFNFFSLKIIIAFFSAVILIWTTIIALNAENETKRYQQEGQRKSDKRLQVDSIINSKNDLLNSKNDSLNKKSNEVIALQKELLYQLTGGESIPLLVADTTWEPESDNAFIGSYGFPERLILKLINTGKYPINDVRIKYDKFVAYSFGVGEFPEIYLPSNATKVIKSDTLENLTLVQLNNVYGFTMKYTIIWKTIEYSYFVTIFKNEKSERLRPFTFTIVKKYSYNKKTY